MDLKALRTATDNACRLAYEARGTFQHAAVNWADFHCVSAQRVEDDTGHVWHRVEIGEASHDNYEVNRFIGLKLVEQGFGGIEIVSEW